MGLALLQSGDSTDNRSSDLLPTAAAATSKKEISPEELEAKRQELRTLIKLLASECTVCDATALVAACSEKPLTGESLYAASSKLSPQLRNRAHDIAKILREYPEMGADILPAIHEFIDSMSYMDPRRLSALLIPKEDPSLSNSDEIQRAAITFLELEGAVPPVQSMAEYEPEAAQSAY